jgi:oligoendopeptidase F
MSPTKHRHSWDLSVLYASDDDPQIERDLASVQRVNQAFARKWQGRNDYLSDAAVLLEALDEINSILRSYGTDGKPGYYFNLRRSQDLNDPKLRARSNKISEISKHNVNLIRFFRLKLGKVPPFQQRQFLRDPRLKKYHRYLKRLFQRSKYFLSEGEEKVFTLLGSSAYGRWTDMLSGFLAKEERTVLAESGKHTALSFSEINGLMASKNKKVRDSAADAVNDILSKFVDVAENEFNAVLETIKVSDELRGYKRPDEVRHIHDDIDTKVVDALVESVSGRFDIAKRFYALKAKLLGQKELAYHERGVEYGDLGGEYSYTASVTIVDRALAKVDEEFSSIFREFVSNRQIDVFPRKGKRGGAFCTFDLVDFPTFIMLNHTNKLRDVTTLAHEVGHGINDELVRASQPPIYVGTPLSTAEVASTFMEDFTLQELSKGENKERQLAILMMKLSDDISTIIRQIAAYKFELEVHTEYRKRGYLSKEEIGEMFQNHMKAYMGPAVEQSPGSENWWVAWHHFRRPFYVYSYASGLLISKALQRQVKQDPKFVKRVKEFLSAGLSDSPENIFARMGVNIADKSFWDQGLQELDGLLVRAEALAKDLKKI